MPAPRTVAKSAPDLHSTAAEHLRRDGQRYTTSRRALVTALESAERPLTIPELLSEHPELPQSSAYRNLAVLERAGIVERVVATDEFIRYELAEGLLEHHHHMICAGCGSVRDFVMATSAERQLDEAAAVVAELAGFRIESHRFDLLGHCRPCVAAGA